MAWESMESAMLTACYQALGQSVTYVPQNAASSTIYAIVDNGAELIGFDTQASEDVCRARIKESDIAIPRRGDLLQLSAGTVYVVDSVERQNNVEWSLIMTERDR